MRLLISLLLFLNLSTAWAINDEKELTYAIGQVMMVGFSGTEITDQSPIVQEIKHYHIGGVIIDNHKNKTTGVISTNIQNPEQFKKLIAKLQAYSMKYSGYPLLIAINQEGGLVNTLKPSQGFANQDDLSQEALGKQSAAKLFWQTYQRGMLLKKYGVNLNLAPVADLNINPTNPAVGKYKRSFGNNPQKVTEALSIAIDAYKKAGIFCTLKHFPGLGSANQNTDYDSVDITATWQKAELIPYEKLIKTHQACEFIMVSHAINKQLDENGLPLSLSKKVVTDLLIHQLHYQGIIMTDDMDAAMIREHYSAEFAIKQALLAGNNMIIYGGTQGFNPEQDTELLFSTLYRLAKENPEIKQHILQSAQKIIKLKSNFIN